jgi:hypothetical protein
MGVLGRAATAFAGRGSGCPGPPGSATAGCCWCRSGWPRSWPWVDEPPEAGLGRSLPGIFQHLPPPTGITQLPPALAQPSSDGERPAAAGAGEGQPPADTGRAHPRRQHPRPERSVSPGSFKGDAVTRPVGGQTGNGGATPPPGTEPPTTVPPGEPAPVARVRVPPVEARVTPPTALGRDLPEVRVATPEVRVELPAGLTAVP